MAYSSQSYPGTHLSKTLKGFSVKVSRSQNALNLVVIILARVALVLVMSLIVLVVVALVVIMRCGIDGG